MRQDGYNCTGSGTVVTMITLTSLHSIFKHCADLLDARPTTGKQKNYRPYYKVDHVVPTQGKIKNKNKNKTPMETIE